MGSPTYALELFELVGGAVQLSGVPGRRVVAQQLAREEAERVRDAGWGWGHVGKIEPHAQRIVNARARWRSSSRRWVAWCGMPA